MRIKKMTASFGCLDGKTLELRDGFNLIYAPNESGKSTWCAFIRAMLYGIDSAEREKGGKKPDKLRYAPWSGAPMEGEMEIVSGGREITLRRGTKNPASPMREFSAVYTGTENPVTGLTGALAGEALTGVSQTVYRRSAFIEQGSVDVTGAPELEKRIAAIVSTGEEASSYSEANDRLKAWQRKRFHNKKVGALPELENKTGELKRKMGRLEEAARERLRLVSELDAIDGERFRIAAELEETRKSERCRAVSELEETNQNVADFEAACDRAKERAIRSRAALEATAFGDMPPEEAASAAKRDIERAHGLDQGARAKASFILPLILAAAALISAAAGIMLSPYFYAVSAVLAPAALFLHLRGRKLSAAREAAGRELNLLLERYRARDAAGIRAALAEHARLFEEWQGASAEVEEAGRTLSNARAVAQTLNAKMLADIRQSSENSGAAYLERSLAAAEKRRTEARAELSELNGYLNALGDPLVMETELRLLQGQREELLRQFEELQLAIDTLRDADAEIQSKFSPRLSERASELMEFMSGGRYARIGVDRDFSATARISGDTLPRDAGYLSFGARDLLYLALRLAICELALPGEEACPLVLDDSLVNLDRERSKKAVSLLKELAKERQVILFTCRDVDLLSD